MIDNLNLKIQTTPLFTRNGTKEEITANPNIIAAAFSNDVLKDGNNSDVIELKNGNLVIPRIRACSSQLYSSFKNRF